MPTLRSAQHPTAVEAYLNDTYPYIHATYNETDDALTITLSIETLPAGVEPKYSPIVTDCKHNIYINTPTNPDGVYAYALELTTTDPTTSDNTFFENLNSIISAYVTNRIKTRCVNLSEPELTTDQLDTLLNSHSGLADLFQTVGTNLGSLKSLQNFDTDTINNIKTATHNRKQTLRTTTPSVTTITCPACQHTSTHIHRTHITNTPPPTQRLYCPDCGWNKPDILADTHKHEHSQPVWD